MIQLRCVEVDKWGPFFIGDICRVTVMNHKKRRLTTFTPEGQKRISSFRYTIDKEIKFEGNTFRLQCPLPG